MKKLFILFFAIAAFHFSEAQVRSCNLEVTLMSPIEYDFVQTGKPMAISVKIRNLGPGVITAKDTIIYTLLYDGDSVISAGKPMMKAYVGYSLNTNQEAVEPVYTGVMLNYNTGGVHVYCVDVKLLNRSATAGSSDPVSTNNRSCHNVYVTIFSSGISNGEASDNDNNVVVSPNPASTATRIAYSLNEKSEVNIIVTDIQGRKVAEAVNAVKAAGNHEQLLDISGFTPGIYFLQCSVNGKIYTSKLVKN